jgi:hypothetical protein
LKLDAVKGIFTVSPRERFLLVSNPFTEAISATFTLYFLDKKYNVSFTATLCSITAPLEEERATTFCCADAKNEIRKNPVVNKTILMVNQLKIFETLRNMENKFVQKANVRQMKRKKTGNFNLKFEVFFAFPNQE